MRSDIFDKLSNTSPLSSANEDYIASLYEQYLENRSELDASWCQFFDSFNHDPSSPDLSRLSLEKELFAMQRKKPMTAVASTDIDIQSVMNVQAYIQAMYNHAHLDASTNPLSLEPKQNKQIQPSSFDCTDYDRQRYSLRWQGHVTSLTLREIQSRLESAYTSNIGFEWMYAQSTQEREWLQDKIEALSDKVVDISEVLDTFKQIYAAEASDKYLGIRYVGQKRFSLQGAESLIPSINTAIAQAVKDDCDEVVIGMAHRGRLSVMLNVCGMPMSELCQKFEGISTDHNTSGDVKYHMGYSRDRMFGDKCVHVSLCFNPSHLEFICPVAMGSVRARLDSQNKGETKFKNSTAILVHGDASFMGQGVVSECLNMSYTDAYNINGVVHIVVNNQIGFTANPTESRSTTYATDIAKVISAPVFHVNGDDPIAVVQATRLAVQYRACFKKDVVVDIVCYRRFGHNETDDPSITDPLMYRNIKQHPTVHSVFEQSLLSKFPGEADQFSSIKRAVDKVIKSGNSLIDVLLTDKIMHYRNMWQVFTTSDYQFHHKTDFSKQRLTNIGKLINAVPDGFSLSRSVELLINQRRKMIETEKNLNWGMGEMLTYASLLIEGFAVRLVGQDSQRGTFSHRHAVIHDCDTGDSYCSLKQFESRGVHFDIFNSVLSEQAALGFEYGYSNTDPYTLVIWEAQFGDFSNGAQVIIDQFISSAWQKWQRLSGLVMLLPHGYEGQGPEHSSARLERYLQLCAQNNMQVCVPTTPAQFFHLIRRQMHQETRIPLIVMTPKSLLRHPKATSDLDELANSEFKLIINESAKAIKPAKVKRLIITYGKIYFDLIKVRSELNITDIAIIRIEQLYPTPTALLRETLSTWKHVLDIVWCQEEPQNQGAWHVKRKPVEECLVSGQSLSYVGRPKSASPATGYVDKHAKEVDVLIKEALLVEQISEK